MEGRVDQCDLCSCFGTYDRTLVGERVTVVAPNGRPLKRTLHFLEQRRVAGELVPLCISCIRRLDKSKEKE